MSKDEDALLTDVSCTDLDSRGVLNVTPCQLRLAVPSSRGIDRLRVLTELRERTEPSAAAQSPCATYRFPPGDSSEDKGIRIHREPCNASNVFLRVRILPSGPWAFTRVFRMPHPRPADWSGDAANAGTMDFPRRKPMALALNTELLHTCGAQSLTNLNSFPPNPMNGSMIATSEQLLLEVCLFDNSAASSLYLLGRGTLPLTPAIVTGHPGQAKVAVSPMNFHAVKKEVTLLEPVTGNIMSTVQLEMTFMAELEATSAPAVVEGTMMNNATWYPQKMDHALERNASHTSLAIWTLKSVFYSLDPQNNKIIRLDSILAHLANAHLLEETLASECIRSKLLEVSHAPSSQDRDAMGGDKGSDRRFSGEFSPHVCHLLAPQGVKRDSLVPWEVWAAFCETVCQTPYLSHTSVAFVWKRAAKLRPQPTSFSNHLFRHSETFHLLSSTERRIHTDQGAHISNTQSDSIGCRGSTSPAFCPSHADGEDYEPDVISGGYGDVVLSDEDSVLIEDIGESLSIGTATPSYLGTLRSIRGRSRRTSGQIASSQPCGCRQSPVDRIRWSLSHRPSDSEALRWKNCRGTSARGARRTHRSSNDISVHRLTRSSPSIAVTWPCRAPVTEGLSPRESPSARDTVEYCGDRKDGHVKPCKGEEALDMGVYGSMNHGEAVGFVRSCSQQQVSVQGNTGGQHHVRMKSAVNTRPAILRSFSVAAAWEKDNNKFESEMILRETRSAKRKASKYKASMAETQRALKRERRKAGVLEARVLEDTAKLLQRDRARILQAAHHRAQLLKHREERARLEQRSVAKRIKVKADAAAATTLQKIARGYIERLRYKMEVQRIKALQRACKYLLQERRRHHRRAQEGQAILSLQNIWRGRLERRRPADWSASTTKAQALLRGFLCRGRVRGPLQLHRRRRETAAISIQKRRRMAVVRRDFVALRAATVRVQGSYRRRRDLQEFIRRKHATEALQVSYSAGVRIKKARQERKVVHIAAQVLQGAVRRWVQRRLLRRMLEAQRRDRAAASLQIPFRRYLERKNLYDSWVMSTALTLQRTAGKYSVNLSEVTKRTKENAATKIQAVYRGQRSRFYSSIFLMQQKASSIKIQSFFRQQRGRRAGKHRQLRWRQERSALVIQRMWEGKRGMIRAVSPVNLLRKVTDDRQMPTVLTRQGLQRHEHCPRPRMVVELQHAFQTVANRMVTLGAIDAIGAHNLKHLLDLDEHDPKLQCALRETLAKLEVSCFVGQRLECQAGPETGSYAIKVGDGVTESLSKSLTLLELGLMNHLRE